MARWKWRFWCWPSELRESGLLGMNRRNHEYLAGYNPRRFYPRVDDKLLTKQICVARGIRVPATYAVIARNGDVGRFPGLLDGRQEFVIKPAKGAEGRGIVVIASHDGRRFTTPGGHTMTDSELRYHLSTILSGLHSLGGQTDRAIIEQRVMRHPAFDQVAVGGTPDIRIIIYRGVPAMAMVRLPTAASRGRANLHQGAVAAGIDLASGQTFGGVCRGRAVGCHPDTGHPVAGLTIPEWQTLLLSAVDLSEGLELGYLGVDFVVDATVGPVVLEANARPGLAIQVAQAVQANQAAQATQANHAPAGQSWPP
ncbi:MAG: alpha-L-glutamate ligase-like protein, partial [Patescibacteria group bacterium]|nr:alpha-L-glutamate ligase-like protein [Patescibacteria group bacterium]